MMLKTIFIFSLSLTAAYCFSTLGASAFLPEASTLPTFMSHSPSSLTASSTSTSSTSPSSTSSSSSSFSTLSLSPARQGAAAPARPCRTGAQCGPEFCCLRTPSSLNGTGTGSGTCQPRRNVGEACDTRIYYTSFGTVPGVVDNLFCPCQQGLYCPASHEPSSFYTSVCSSF